MSNFKVGDRVRRKFDDIVTKRTGTIKRMCEPCVTQYPVLVDWDDGVEYGVWLSHDQIAPNIDEASKTEAVENEGKYTLMDMMMNATPLIDLPFSERPFIPPQRGELPEVKWSGDGFSQDNQHNDHYTKLGDYEPFKVYEAFINGNEELFQDNPKLAGYYLNVIKYLARINSKDTPLKNMEKAKVYLDKMVELIEGEA